MTRIAPDQSGNATVTNQSSQPNAPQSNAFTSTSSGNQNPFGNLLGNILNNPNTMMQMTSMIFGGDGAQGGNINLGNLIGGLSNTTGTSGTNVSQQQDINSLLNNIINPNTSTETASRQAEQNVPEQSANSTTENVQYPILNVPNQHLNHLNELVDNISGRNSVLPTLPSLNYPLNVLTAVGRTLRNYHTSLTGFLPYISLMADLLERESLITNAEEREKVKRLINNIFRGLEDIVKSTSLLQPIVNGLDFGNAPAGGHLRMMAAAEVQIGVEEIPTREINLQPNSTSQNMPSTSENANNTLFNQPQGRSNANPFQQIISEMNQPGGMEMMMNMVGGILGGGNRGAGNQINLGNLLNPQSSSGQPNPLNNLISQMMGNLGGGSSEVIQQTGDARSYFNSLNTNSRRTVLLRDIPSNILTIQPDSEFADFINNILSQLTIQEVLDFKSVNFKGFARLRKASQEKLSNYLSSKFNGDKTKLVNHIKDLVAERFIIHENDVDKMTNESFNIDDHLCSFFKKLVDILLDENINDMRFETLLRREFLVLFGNLFEDLKSSYSTGKDGAFYFLDCNLEDLLASIIGKSALETLISIDANFIEDFTDNVVTLYSSEKNNLNNFEENTQMEGKETSQNKETDLDVEKIMELALLDKNRAESFTKQNIEFSPQYSSTSLFK